MLFSGKLNELERTVEHFEKALEINPQSDEAYLGLGFSLLFTGKLIEVERILEHYIAYIQLWSKRFS
jgi:tetratricopeptide (TPR) repeat protein